MDPIGITIGAASLLTLFKTCLELYEAIECGRNLSKDYEILATKVGIERVRLALWGSMVGLYDLPTDRSTKAGKLDTSAHTVDPRLKEPRIFRAVSDILNCMLRLFQDSGSLTRRYGLQQMTSSDLALRGSGRNVITTTFKKTYAHLHASASLIQQGSSLVTAARWAIKDKKRFERFVDDLRSFNDSLALLFPDVDVNTRVAMATEINDSTDIDGLQMIEDAVSDLAGGEQLVEAASLRITELSQYSKSVAETKETEATEDSMPDVNVDRMARQLERMEISMSKRAELRGSLIFSCWGVVGGEYYAQNHFYGIEEEDFLVERQKKAEYVKPTYQAWCRSSFLTME
ncbi:hypothetical protein N7462_003506 [Penicillium macrosclerotiorum]|uniref:uncharacterized protein n=1 Tax=Penicillium macrosclerotiorum TaxID=303699 RepID=UPI002546ACF4|nr:uncharacterized protein N7462_003506 [Penicillium macrosclerotiorum]KAJ5689114.1 hypothetical protein N7462_003506 [Penicillium macrosclerotiorum]